MNTIDVQAARRWQSMPLQASPWLHDEINLRMQDRLNCIKCQPTTWLHWAALSGGVGACRALMQRYPQSVGTIFETTHRRAQTVEQQFRQLQQTRPLSEPYMYTGQGPSLPHTVTIITQIEQPVQMLWANMVLHTTDDPQAMMAQWYQALEVDGFLMFSCLGMDTLKSLRDVYRTSGWPAPAHMFMDMHDWGDRLAAAGFANSVVDMERLTLSFTTPERLLQELRGLGRNLSVHRFAALRGRRWYRQLLQALAQAPLQLDFEIVYGHAFKPAPRHPVSVCSAISLLDMRTALSSRHHLSSTVSPTTDINRP